HPPADRRIEPGLIDRPYTLRQHARPGDRETIRLQADLAHQGDVIAPAVIVIAGNIAVVIVMHFAGRMAETIPDRLALAVLVPGALDLVGRSRRAPDEIVWKCDLCHGCSLRQVSIRS